MLISPSRLQERWSLNPSTVLHIGAHEAEELTDYGRLGWGASRTVWVEAIPDLARQLARQLAGRPNHRVINAVAWDSDEELTFRVASSTQSSSVLPMKYHLQEYPSIVESSVFSVHGERLESVLVGDPIMSGIDFINLDIQGAELHALRGLGNALESTKAIYSEINLVELYEGCATLASISAYLRIKGFRLVDAQLTSAGWGDALWLRREDVGRVAGTLLASRIRCRVFSARTRRIFRGVHRRIKRSRAASFVRGKTSSALVRAMFALPLSTRLGALRVLNQSVGRGFTGGLALEVALLLEATTLPTEPVIFDVGANVGSWTSQMRLRLPQAACFAFEPSSAAFDRLRTAVRDGTMVVPVRIAFSDTAGSGSLFFDNPGSSLASLYQRDLANHGISLDNHEVVETARLDEWCFKNNVVPDIIKIDVEGHELAVLRGSSQILNRVHAVQFEFGGTCIDAGIWFRDLWNFLEPYGFEMFRMTPCGLLRIKKYSEQEEVFVFQNYVAVRSS